MRTSHDIKKKATAISEQDQKILRTIIEEIKFLLETPKINEDTLLKINNILSSLNSLKENYTSSIIRALKQNHMLD
tara:strand:+ start:219 stop:446 length:228 start_codon:yes stop_codon:yes gene_type:complete